jgi:hypothetical protein
VPTKPFTPIKKPPKEVDYFGETPKKKLQFYVEYASILVQFSALVP